MMLRLILMVTMEILLTRMRKQKKSQQKNIKKKANILIMDLMTNQKKIIKSKLNIMNMAVYYYIGDCLYYEIIAYNIVTMYFIIVKKRCLAGMQNIFSFWFF